MRTTDTMIALRVSTDLLHQIDTDAQRLGLSRSALVRARLQHPEQVDSAVVRGAAEQLRAVLDLVDTGELAATPLAAPHLRGAVDALDQIDTDHQESTA